MISLSESAIPDALNDNGFKKASKDSKATRTRSQICSQERDLFSSSDLSQQICRLFG